MYFSFLSGAINSIVSLFTGGGPSTEDVIKDEFEKQKEFLEQKFEETHDWIIRQSLTEHVIAGKTDLDVLSLKHDFIVHFKQYQGEALEEVANSIINEMTYFEHRRIGSDLRHTFEELCVEM